MNVQYLCFQGIPNKNLWEQLYCLRKEVFIKEKGMENFSYMDNQDEKYLQVYSTDEDNVLLGNSRCGYINEGTWKIERVCVHKKFRAEGIGKNMILLLEKEIKKRQGNVIVLSSQEQAINFYKNLGFHPEGKLFDYFGISHVTMKKNLHISKIQ